MNRNKKVILINGSTTNIGKATALLIAEKNYKLILVDNKKDDLNNLANKCKQVTDEIIEINKVIKEMNDIENVINKAIDSYERIDVIINIFEMAYKGNVFNENPLEMYNKIKTNNIEPIDMITQAALPHLKKTKGCIINISNVISDATVRDKTVYNVSKTALTHYTKSIALDLASKGVRIHAIHSGPVWGKLLKDENIDNNVIFDDIDYEIEPDNIAMLIVYIASDKFRSVKREMIIEAGSSI